MISQGALRDVEMCRIIKRLAARVTSIDVKGQRDHVPIAIQFKIRYLVDFAPINTHRYDRDRMLKSVLGDAEIRDPFVRSVNRELESRQSEFVRLGFNPDKQWGMIQDVVLNKSKEFFTRNDRKNEPRKQQIVRTLRQTLLEDRRELALHRGLNRAEANLPTRWCFCFG